MLTAGERLMLDTSVIYQRIDNQTIYPDMYHDCFHLLLYVHLIGGVHTWLKTLNT